ncbi:MAG: hypothetical protein HY842_01190 [Bacteroidetes bacterium]|nr:hypothetical protein [Bacteroidota bacterium]
MTTIPKAVLDTSALICLYFLDLLEYLKLLYSEIRIPREVEREFLEKHVSEEERSRRYTFLTGFYDKNLSWFLPCIEYGDDLVKIYLDLEGMDKGEAEALAQNQYYENTYEVLVDEKIARIFAQSQSMKVHGTLSLLADMDIKFGVCDYFSAVERLQKENNTFFSRKIIQSAYEMAKK